VVYFWAGVEMDNWVSIMASIFFFWPLFAAIILIYAWERKKTRVHPVVTKEARQPIDSDRASETTLV
jgi:TRAP-type mannitol/chloroaromatic compound transport system permease small subunit